MKCKQPFVFSFVTFGELLAFFHHSQLSIHEGVMGIFCLYFEEVLPLIEFQLEEGISDSEALRLLQSSDVDFDRPAVEINSDFQTLLINDTSLNKTDLFTDALMNLEV